MLVLYRADIISSKCNLFWPWYSWKIHHLALNNNHSLISFIFADSHQHVLPRLWCGMGDGKIKIFDAMTWNLESQYINTKSVVVNIYLFIYFILLFFILFFYFIFCSSPGKRPCEILPLVSFSHFNLLQNWWTIWNQPRQWWSLKRVHSGLFKWR